MLDNETKRRIDTARDILVGKLPDPKSQVEQITIALIYKFMDDMDAQSVEFGGEPSFFVGDYEKFGWRKIFAPNIGGHELLALYGEAITSLNQNPNLPQLFRDVFKNAFLPYRDPETLKMFLKNINEFKYDHSERLGDAFEYLLSVLGSQGDAGQFRTPRHIIDFIVETLAPKKNETICDPACGTAGFLISSFKHILKANTKQNNGDLLSPDDRRKLMQNFVGYDISPDMVRLSLVNLYLHGFPDPHIYEYDTLSSEDRWNEHFDIVMANPPFMSPKGGIKPHKKFSIQANRSEVLFVDYIAEHIHPTTGRAGIIVPEGIIFQSAGAYKDLRKMLVDKNYLYAVVSLPAGVFQPYSGVKTSVLLMDKTLAGKTDKILFVKIQNDGFGLGAQRREMATSDLPDALNLIRDFQAAVLQGDTSRFEGEDLPLQAVAVEKTQIAANGDYNLSGDRYKSIETRQHKFELVDFEDLIENVKYTNKIQRSEFLDNGQFPIVDQSEKFIAGYWNNEADVFKIEKPIIAFGDHTRIFKYVDFDFVLGADGIKILQPNSKIDSKFFYNVLQNIEIKSLGYSRHYKELKETKIPLPPLSIQKEIVEKIEGFQRIIDGAKKVVENYKPQIDISPDWEMVELGEVCEVVSGYSFDSKDFSNNGKTRSIKITNVGVGYFVENDDSFLPENFADKYPKFKANRDDIVIALTRSIIGNGLKVCRVPESYNGALVNQRVGLLRISQEKADINFVFLQINSETALNYIEEKARSLMQPNLSIKDLAAYKIPLPPLEVQQEIVARIEREQSLVNCNRELVEIFEAKIKAEVNKLWEE